MGRGISLFLIFVVAVVAFVDVTLASSWPFGSGKVYTAWHKTELEKWLDDHDIPYPAAADRKDLSDFVATNWDKVSTAVYETWEDNRLRTWLEQRGIEFDAAAKKDALVNQVKSNWYGVKANVESSWETVKNWIFDTWSESHLKAFLDKHAIPCPQPVNRNTLIAKARESYDTIRQSVGDIAKIPGNWLFEVWSDSDLKSWCDYRGIPVPQGSKRNELIALVRRNMRKTKFQGKDAYLSASDSVSKAASVAYDFASSVVKTADSSSSPDTDLGSRITDYAHHKGDQVFDAVINSWSGSRLKAYLDQRDVQVPKDIKLDELRAAVRDNTHRAKARAGFNDAAFDSWSTEQLRDFLGREAEGVRDELIAAAKKNYASASAKGGEVWASLTKRGAKATGYLFDQWSDSDLKSFLDSYGVQISHGLERNELIAAAKKNSRYFTQGPNWYNGEWITQLQSYANQGMDYIKNFIGGASSSAYNAGDTIKEHATIAKDRVNEATHKAGDRVHEEEQKAYDRVKEEL